jgi:hypothetical protein
MMKMRYLLRIHVVAVVLFSITSFTVGENNDNRVEGRVNRRQQGDDSSSDIHRGRILSIDDFGGECLCVLPEVAKQDC